MPASKLSLVSIISFCKNRKSTILRSLDSVLGQTYSNIEFVVQDGASTDGTLEILREYAKRDPRIKLVSEPDSGPAEAFWKVMQRCQGDLIGTCLSDEALLPDAVQFAVDEFSADPKLGALTCDGYNTDEHGQFISNFITGDFNFVAYLFGLYCPFWPGSFFSRKALADIGLYRPGWTIECLEFEVWVRFAMDHKVKYVPKPLSNYAIHSGQLSNTPRDFYEHIDGRLTLIDKLFSDKGFIGVDKRKHLECKIGQLEQFHNHVRAYKLKDDEQKLRKRIESLAEELQGVNFGTSSYPQRISPEMNDQILRHLQGKWQGLARLIPKSVRSLIPKNTRMGLRRRFFVMGTIAMTGNLPASEGRRERDRQHYRWAVLARYFPGFLRRRLPLAFKKQANEFFTRALIFLSYLPAYVSWWVLSLWIKPLAPRSNPVAPTLSDKPLNMYPLLASIYDSRGQIREALEMWRHAEALNDPQIDGMACQAILKVPDTDYQEIASFQRRWAERHAAKIKPESHAFRPFNGRRKIRVGYHCSFMDGDTIRYIMRHVMAAHDRTKFEIYGYAPMPLPADIKLAFDVTRIDPALDDAEFCALVRKDEIDVFVEMSGFSPGHRYLAMAARCAPVQVSYLNHHGTSCVPAIDYFLSDEISTPTGSDVDRTFTEQIYRLPSCLLCYDYEGYEHPPVSEPPSPRQGFVTFGCFGSGSKISTDLVEIWAELLDRVPGSKFYLRNAQLTPPDNRRFMIDRFRRFNIDPERIRLDGGTDRMTLLRGYADVDVTMDTWPYCGGNTVAESLWQGVPVVTLRGSRISSRYGASLLKAAGCEDMVGNSVDEYIDIAAKLAGNQQRLFELRPALRAMSKQHGLGDSRRFARDLEKAYLYMISPR